MMQMGIHSLPARRWGQVALVALLGLTLALVTVSAGNASARHAGHAVAAKKKCKKKKHRSASVAKKKKCKKKHAAPPVTPVVTPAPLVRATLSWTADDEVDLHVFDASGNHAGWVNPTGVVNNIPNARHNGDAGPGGPSETFTDDIFVVGGPSNREFAYVACLYDGPDPDPYGATFQGVTRDGGTTTLPLDGPALYRITAPGGPTLSDSQVASACGVS
jgi:hypothetical protein